MLLRASPTLPVREMRPALAYYEERLGFRTVFKLEDDLHPQIPYAIVRRDEVEIHLSLSAGAVGTGACYVLVDDARALFDEARERGATVVRPIEDSSYGMRDFTLADADGNRLGFGQPLGH